MEEQKDRDNLNVSTIDLGISEDKLKEIYKIPKDDSLIVIKTDIKNLELSSIYVQYELFHPNTLERLDLSYCNEIKIAISVPVNFEDSTISLYESLNQSGYNLFDAEDDFYKDICSTYTSINGTDLTLADRKNEVFSSIVNISVCQTGCKFESYNKTTRKSKCKCKSQINDTITDITKLDFSTSFILNSFLATLKNSNFLVLKCYKLAISLENILNNKGRIIMTIIYFFFLISLIIFIIKGRKRIKIFINEILRNKSNQLDLLKNKKTKIKTKSKKLNIQNEKKNKENRSNKNMAKDNKKEEEAKIEKKSKNKSLINRIKIKKIKLKEPPKKIKNYEKYKKSLFNSSNIPLNTHSNLNIKKQKDKVNINIIPINNINFGRVKKSIVNKKNIEIFTINNGKKSLKENNFIYYRTFNDQELNTLKYNLAIQIDKRTYCQYYFSLLKKKHLILFTFIPTNDYNLFSLKFEFFLLSFSLYFTINGFFFTDNTMHKIYIDYGAYNLIFRISQIFYSSVISAAINMILKLLSLSENNILAIKRENNIKKATKISKNIEKYLIIKFIIFILLSHLLLLFFWYFISCFSAVYINTQIILIKDTLISFALSMIYPFGLNLLPGIFRIPALRAKNKNKLCLYQTSGILSLI